MSGAYIQHTIRLVKLTDTRTEGAGGPPAFRSRVTRHLRFHIVNGG